MTKFSIQGIHQAVKSGKRQLKNINQTFHHVWFVEPIGKEPRMFEAARAEVCVQKTTRVRILLFSSQDTLVLYGTSGPGCGFNKLSAAVEDALYRAQLPFTGHPSIENLFTWWADLALMDPKKTIMVGGQ